MNGGFDDGVCYSAAGPARLYRDTDLWAVGLIFGVS